MRRHNRVKFSKHLTANPKFFGIGIYDLILVSFCGLVTSIYLKGSSQAFQNLTLFLVCGGLYAFLVLKNTRLPEGYFKVSTRKLLSGEAETMISPSQDEKDN